MKERPILFSAPMVRAILDGRKTQTRRVLKIPGIMPRTSFTITSPDEEIIQFDDGTFHYLSTAAMSGPYPCPYGRPGDQLWVRETWGKLYPQYDDDPVWWRADYTADELETLIMPKWRPSIHMPRKASRILLEITNVRAERLQSMRAADALAEGVESSEFMTLGDDLAVHPVMKHAPWDWSTPLILDRMPAYVARFILLWDSINGVSGKNWNSNPWVWVVEFKRVKEVGCS